MLFAQSLHGVADGLAKRIEDALPTKQQAHFRDMVNFPITNDQIHQAREYVLNTLFWDLIYWKAPQWYHELTEG